MLRSDRLQFRRNMCARVRVTAERKGRCEDVSMGRWSANGWLVSLGCFSLLGNEQMPRDNDNGRAHRKLHSSHLLPGRTRKSICSMAIPAWAAEQLATGTGSAASDPMLRRDTVIISSARSTVFIGNHTRIHNHCHCLHYDGTSLKRTPPMSAPTFTFSPLRWLRSRCFLQEVIDTIDQIGQTVHGIDALCFCVS